MRLLATGGKTLGLIRRRDVTRWLAGHRCRVSVGERSGLLAWHLVDGAVGLRDRCLISGPTPLLSCVIAVDGSLTLRDWYIAVRGGCTGARRCRCIVVLPQRLSVRLTRVTKGMVLRLLVDRLRVVRRPSPRPRVGDSDAVGIIGQSSEASSMAVTKTGGRVTATPGRYSQSVVRLSRLVWVMCLGRRLGRESSGLTWVLVSGGSKRRLCRWHILGFASLTGNGRIDPAPLAWLILLLADVNKSEPHLMTRLKCWSWLGCRGLGRDSVELFLGGGEGNLTFDLMRLRSQWLPPRTSTATYRGGHTRRSR